MKWLFRLAALALVIAVVKGPRSAGRRKHGLGGPGGLRGLRSRGDRHSLHDLHDLHDRHLTDEAGGRGTSAVML